MNNLLANVATIPAPSVRVVMPSKHEVPPRIRRYETAEARNWLFDCFGDDLDAFAIINTGSAITIFQLIQRHYEGGWAAFIKDAA